MCIVVIRIVGGEYTYGDYSQVSMCKWNVISGLFTSRKKWQVFASRAL